MKSLGLVSLILLLGCSLNIYSIENNCREGSTIEQEILVEADVKKPYDIDTSTDIDGSVIPEF